jgi:aspartyl-tRNA(Asn)/glutamyl-tRNA(Gln) amidotransferase subunit C
MSISREEVARLAGLAHLDLDPEETDRMARDLGQILAYAERLPAIPDDAAEDGPPGPLREDRVEPGITAGEALSSAPDWKGEGEFFQVPPAIEKD